MPATLPTSPTARLTGHKGAVHALTYSAGTGQYLLSGSSDRCINLWNPAKAASPLVQSYTGAHAYEVLSVAVAADNARFVSGGGDKIVFVWDVVSATTLRRFGGGAGAHGARVECVAFGGDGDSVVVSGSFDSSVRIWDTKSKDGRPLMVLPEAKDSVSSLAVVEHEVMAGSVDGRVRVYDLRMGMVYVDVIGREDVDSLSMLVALLGRRGLTSTAEPITSLTPSLKADTFLVSSLDSTIRLMDKANGKLLQSYRNADYVNTTYRIRSTLGANDSIVLSGSEDGWIYAWDVVSGQLLHRVIHGEQDTAITRSSRKVVSALAYKKKANEWASAGGDGSIVVWSSP